MRGITGDKRSSQLTAGRACPNWKRCSK